MKVLFLTPQLPFPAISGGVIKSYKLLEHLNENYKVSMCCLLKNEQEAHDLVELKQHFPHLKIYHEPVSIGRTILNLLKSYIKNVPLTIFRNGSSKMRNQIQQIANQFDAIFIDHYLMFQYLPCNFKGKVIVHQHNAEFLMWSRYSEHESNFIKSLILKLECERIKHYELMMCQKADVVLAAPNDQKALNGLGHCKINFIDTYHLGDEENLWLPPISYHATKQNLLFIGTLTWEANIDGLCWFLSECWPLIKAKVPQVKFSVVGKCSTKLKKRLLILAPDIELLGFVDELDELYQNHRVFVAPLRFGSGIKVKVVNSLYRGIPTVTTSVGAEGLDLNNGEELFIADNKTVFSENIISLLNNSDIWHAMSLKSRAAMRQKYTWKNVMDNVDKSFNNE